MNVILEINLEKMVREWLEKIAERGKIETWGEQILISTAVLLWDFPRRKSDKEFKSRVEKWRKKAGLFFPVIIDIILDWKNEGRGDILEKIAKMA